MYNWIQIEHGKNNWMGTMQRVNIVLQRKTPVNWHLNGLETHEIKKIVT